MGATSSTMGAAVQAISHHPGAEASMEPWSSPQWIDIWWHCLGSRQPGRRLRPLQLQAGATWLPLVALRRHGVRRLEGAGGESLRRDLQGGPEVWAAAAEQLAARADWDWLDLVRMVQPAAHGWGAALRQCGLMVKLGPMQRQRYIALDRPWAEVEQDISPALLRRLPRHERELRRKDVNLALVSEPEAAGIEFERCLEVEASGWKGRQGTAMLSRPGVAAFYRQLVRHLAEQGLLQLYLLQKGTELIAFDLAVLTPCGLAGLKIGMAESWKRWMPGMVLQFWVLCATYEQGMREYDFLGDDEPYKADWSPHARSLCRLQAFACSARGRVLVLAHRARSTVHSLGHAAAARAQAASRHGLSLPGAPPPPPPAGRRPLAAPGSAE